MANHELEHHRTEAYIINPENEMFHIDLEIHRFKQNGQLYSFTIDPEERLKPMWGRMAEGQGPFVLYEAQRDYYEDLQSPTRN